MESICDRLERRETRLRLEADARKVWGSESGSMSGNASPPKVFSFIGKSAESVREEACARGVRVGVEYELVGKQCLSKWAGETTVYSDYS